MKRLFKINRVAFQAINRNRRRSILTALGIIIGVSAVIITISAGEGARLAVDNEIAGLGNNLLVIHVKEERRGGIEVRMGKELDRRDLLILAENALWMPKVAPMVGLGVRVIGGQGYKTTTINGTSHDYFDIVNRPLVAGNVFSAADVASARKVCLIGERIREALFPNVDPVGEQVRIDNVPFTVVGLLAEKGQGMMGMDMDDLVVAPYTTVQNRLAGKTNFDMIWGGASSEAHVQDAKEEVTALLRESHGLLPDEEDDFEIHTQVELQEITGEITGILTFLLGAVAGISLIVGGIGIMNIMLVSVVERTREIGVRLAIGARESDILAQFLIEAITLSLSGGLIGILVGILGNQLISWSTGFYVPTAAYSVLIGFGVSVLVGVVFGFFPARKAARLNPIEALRFE